MPGKVYLNNMDSIGREDEIHALLDEALPVIHATLVSYYRFIEEEAEAFEDTLCVWFGRVARRLGTSRTPPSELREQLLFVACKYARAFQIAKFKGIEPAQEEFTMALARPPEEVAVELLNRLQMETTHV